MRFATCMELASHTAMLKAVIFSSRGVRIRIGFVQNFAISAVQRQLVSYRAVQQCPTGGGLERWLGFSGEWQPVGTVPLDGA